MFAAFNTFEDFQRTVGGNGEFIHALELVGDAETLTDEEIDAVVGAVTDALVRDVGARIRT